MTKNIFNVDISSCDQDDKRVLGWASETPQIS